MNHFSAGCTKQAWHIFITPPISCCLCPLELLVVLEAASADTSPFVSFRNHSPLMSFGASFVSFLVSVEGLKVAEEFFWERFICLFLQIEVLTDYHSPF